MRSGLSILPTVEVLSSPIANVRHQSRFVSNVYRGCFQYGGVAAIPRCIESPAHDNVERSYARRPLSKANAKSGK
jgi:hypothetical protein